MKICSAIILVPLFLLLPLVAGCDQQQAREEAAEMTGGEPVHGRQLITDCGCIGCHTVPGVHGANGLVGPPLTSMAGRSYVAGVLKNTPENLTAWLKDPPSIEPRTAMPNLHLSDSEARDIAAYLYTLR